LLAIAQGGVKDGDAGTGHASSLKHTE